MKKILLLLCIGAFMIGCKKDKGDGLERLHYDTANATGPLLDAATWEAGIRFDESELARFIDQRITKIEYYIGNSPANLGLVIYEDDNSLPGEIVYQASVGFNTRTGWNTHNLSRPYTITGEPIWIAVKLVHDIPQQSIGCDSGPAFNGGDWLYSSEDGEWRTYRERTRQAESVNWNIRGVVEE